MAAGHAGRSQMLSVRLRLVEIDHVPTKCVDDASAAISALSQATGDWSFRFSEIEDENELGLMTYRIRITHNSMGRDDAIGRSSVTLILLEKLCQQLCDPKGALYLNKIIKHENLVIQPYVDGSDGPTAFIDRMFGQKFIANVVRYTPAGQACFRDMDAIQSNPLTRNGTKWFRGAMSVAVTLCNFLELYEDHLELIPGADVALTGQRVIEHMTGEAGRLVTAEMLGKAEVLLMILKKGAEFAPWLRSTLELQLEKLDEKALARTLVDAFDKVDTATAGAVNSLRDLNAGIANGQISNRAIDDSLQHLTNAMKDTVPLFETAQKQRDKHFGSMTGCAVTSGVALVAAVGLFMINPPAGSLLATVIVEDLLVVHGLTAAAGAIALGTGAKAGVSGTKLVKSKELLQKVHKIGENCHQIWLFLTLVMFRRTGRLTDDDERLVAFAQLMARTFQTVDVLREWNDPAYVGATVEVEMERLERSVGDVRTGVEPMRQVRLPMRHGHLSVGT